MRIRPLRPQIYQPIIRYGVALSDWKFVIIIVAFSYAIPFLLNLSFYGIPLPLALCLASLMLSLLFFRWTRLGRRPHWLQHTIQAWLTRSHKRRRVLPTDGNARRAQESWILDQHTQI